MQQSLFNLSFDNWKVVLLTFLPAAINISIFFYVFFFLQKNRTNRAFYIFLLLLGLWQLGEGFARTSVLEENAAEWYRISGAPSLMMLPFGLVFTIRFIGFRKRIGDIFLFSFFFLPAIIFELFLIRRLDKYILIKSEFWNWIISPELSMINMVIYYWMAFTALIMLALFWVHYIKNRTKAEVRAKSLLLAIGFTIPTIIGIITEVVFPFILYIDPIPLTTPLMTVFSIFTLIAIKKYNMLDFSPRHQWNEIVENMNEGVLIVNNMDQIQYSNKAFCKMTGYDLEEMKGRAAHSLLDIEQSEMNEVFEKRKEKIADQFELQIKTKSGEKIWVLINIAPYLDANKKIIGSIAIHTNINHLKKTEMNLINKINELNSFFYKASHDLRSPAVTIQGLINLRKLQKEDDSENLFSLIEKCNYQSLLILDNISLITLIQQHKTETRKTDLEMEMKQIIKQINPKELPVSFKISNNIDHDFYTDKDMLNIILRNILDNSVKYRDKNKEKCFVEIHCYSRNRNLNIKITDNGQGICKDRQDKVFDLFFKSNVSTIGLGLYTAKRAAEKLGGNITVRSEEGTGSEFTICLPYQK